MSFVKDIELSVFTTSLPIIHHGEDNLKEEENQGKYPYGRVRSNSIVLKQLEDDVYDLGRKKSPTQLCTAGASK